VARIEEYLATSIAVNVQNLTHTLEGIGILGWEFRACQDEMASIGRGSLLAVRSGRG
jgi:hypothetical protein